MPKGIKGFQKGHSDYNTKESKKKISQSLMGRISPMKGKKHSEEQK